jgi:PAS domain S-box-containing protein
VDGSYTFLNPAWEDVFGYKIEEMLGKKFTDFQTSEYAERDKEEFVRLLQGNTVQGLETVHIGKDGREIHLVFNAKVLVDEQGNPAGTSGTAFDNTRSKIAEEERKKFVMLADSSREFIGMCDLDFKPIYVNPEGIHMVGLPDLEAAIQVKVQDYFFPEDQQFITEEFFPRVLRDGHGDVEIRLRHFQTGRAIWMFYYLFSVRNINGTSIGWATVSRNITERKLAEEEIRKLNTELELRVAERTTELEAKNRELESFSYSVSHDLRAPLRAISGFAEIINRRYRSELNEQAQHYFDNIVTASSRMGQLIDDLLSYSRLGRQAINRSRVNLNHVLTQVADELNSRIIELNASIVIAPDLPGVTGNTTLIQQIFTNLLENALVYHRPDVPPRVQVTGYVENSLVTYRVTDNGQGIAPEFQGKVFNVFQRLHPEEFSPGTGIGLAIVKKAVELQGGKVWIESEVGQGSTFIIQFPEEI